MKGRELFRKKKIPQPSIKREDLTARILSAEYDRLFEKLGTQASLGPYAVLHQLHELMGERGVDVERLRKRLNVQFVAETRRIIADLIGGGDEELVSRLASLALPAQEVFGQKIRYIRELYLNDAVERIKGEEDDLKKAFLKKLTAWAEHGGELDVADLIAKMQETSAHRARFFARDQFSRFNRSVMVASYQQAEAEYVEVLSSNDARVRPTHREWNHKVFTMQGYLADPRYHEYNCRCAAAPLWNLTAAQKKRLVA